MDLEILIWNRVVLENNILSFVIVVYCINFYYGNK